MQCADTPLEDNSSDASAKAMLAFQHTATVLKELPRSTGIHALNQGTDTHFSLQEDLALLKAHWYNFTTGSAKENANPINDR